MDVVTNLSEGTRGEVVDSIVVDAEVAPVVEEVAPVAETEETI